MATITGTAGKDVLTGTTSDDLIQGLGGDDQINGDAGNDTIEGGGGNDVLFGDAGDDTISDDSGNNTLVGGPGADTLKSLDGGSAVLYAHGYVQTDAFADADTLIGGSGDELFYAGFNDTVSGGGGSNVLVLDLAGSSQGLTLDLTPLSSGGSVANGTGLLSGITAISRILGTDQADAITIFSTGPWLTQGRAQVDGNGGDDTLTGGNGDDLLDGGSGSDHLFGGAGDDALYSGDYDLGNPGHDTGLEVDILSGGAGDDYLDGGAGDTLNGGDGTDSVFLNLSGASAGASFAFQLQDPNGALLAGATLIGIEAIRGIMLPNFVNVISLNGQAAAADLGIYGGSDIDIIAGTGFADTIFGGDGDDQLTGWSGDDHLEGGAGNDFLQGGLGHNTLIGGDGSDTASYTDAPAGMSVFLQTGAATDHNVITDSLFSIENVFGSDHNDAITGNAAANSLVGFGGDDVIDGLGGDDWINGNDGADTLRGGDGNDTISSGDDYSNADQTRIDQIDAGAGDDYVRVGRGDSAIGGSGNDRLELDFRGADHGVTLDLSALFTGTAGANDGGTITGFEQLVSWQGTAHDDVLTIGSAFDTVALSDRATFIAGAGDDIITGSGAGDVIYGDAGNDEIFGGGGADWLYAGTGTDKLYGGDGSDQFFVDGQEDLVFEDANGGGDSVTSSGSFYLYANIENLTLADGAGDLFGVGNELDNSISGNDGANLLLGGAGDDTLFGESGNDLLFGEDGSDWVYAGNGIDYVVGGAGNDRLFGEAGSDALYGEDGDDWLDGGTSFDTDILVGGAGNDRLFGNSGQVNPDYDIMNGGDGDDIYYVDTGADLTFEAANGGIDTVYADVTVPNAGVYLYANVENLVLLGTTAFGVGNELDNRLSGSDSANWLLGGAGNDLIYGGGGNDVLFGEAGNDLFLFDPNSGADVIGDFHHGEDKIELRLPGLAQFSDIQSGFIQVGDDGAIGLGDGNFIVLLGVTMSQLTASDFILG